MDSSLQNYRLMAIYAVVDFIFHSHECKWWHDWAGYPVARKKNDWGLHDTLWGVNCCCQNDPNANNTRKGLTWTPVWHMFWRGEGSLREGGPMLIVQKTIISWVTWRPLLLKKGKIKEIMYRKARLNNVHNLGGIWKENGVNCRRSTEKKGLRFSRPQPECQQPNSRWPGIIKFFPARESLISDIPAGDGKIANPFLQCSYPPPYEQRFFHLDRIYARRWSLPLCVCSVAGIFAALSNLRLLLWLSHSICTNSPS